MLQSVVALGVISVVWVLVGFSLAFGQSIELGGRGVVGNPLSYPFFDNVNDLPSPFAATIPLMLFALFQLKFAIITPAPHHRVVRRAGPVLLLPAVHRALQPVHLRASGPLDVAPGWLPEQDGGQGLRRRDGGAHVAGWAALAGAILLGRRKSHMENVAHSPANVPFVLLGTGMLWFGWFGFNAGSALAANGSATLAFATTNTASAAAMLGWMSFDWLRGRKPSAIGACIGAVVGLVAITPAAGFVTVRESILIGLVASVVSNLAVHFRTRSNLDDTLDVFPCHGVGGMVGMLATGIFADKGLADIGLQSPGDGKMPMFLAHLIALVVVSAFSFFGSLLLFKITDLIIPLRVTPEQEEVGLDLSQHGETALGSDLLGGAEEPALAHGGLVSSGA